MQLIMQVFQRMKEILDFIDGSTGDMINILFFTVMVIIQCTNLLDRGTKLKKNSPFIRSAPFVKEKVRLDYGIIQVKLRLKKLE